ncbi:MAG: hypothetical protein ACKVP4_09410 [Hyphomicrobium sp.]
MLTIGLSSWAVDLKDVGAIYPFQGYERPMVIAAIVFYVLWQIWQIGHENAELNDKARQFDARKAKDAVDKY